MSDRSAGNVDERPWYRRTYRWGQTNLTELDPARYDGEWWREHWRRTRVQGLIVNAGGIVAYYPSRFPLHHRAVHLGDRDLYGEIVATAREEGLVVLARMDSNRADERFYLEHPDWFTVDSAGRPYRSGDLYISCVNSPYYEEYLPGVLREIIDRSSPEGFADNSWSGLERSRICYCGNCASKFAAATGFDLPRSHDWDTDAYRRWIAWNYARRIEIWELNNRTTKEAGGPHCLWLGMNAGSIETQSERFRDFRAICQRAEILMLDSQWRKDATGFQSNGDMGKLIHGLLGWEKLVPESMAMYDAGLPTFRLGSKPEPEARMWAVDGFAGGILPWWHHIGADHDDRRQYRTAAPLFAWHEANEQYLVDREPVASVGVVWSQENTDFYGRDTPEERTALPYRGVINALIRARVPYVPVHADAIDQAGAGLTALVLPNVAAMSDAQCAQVRRFVERGGGVVATGETSRYDEWGNPRADFGLADVFAAHATAAHHGSSGPSDPGWESWSAHTHLRLTPSRRGRNDGPRIPGEPEVTGERHAVLDGFEGTDILPFAGRLEFVSTDPDAQTLATFVSPFPIYPPETAWMRHPESEVAALVLHEPSTGGRVAYLPADVDRCFGRDNHPDHAELLANLVRWAVQEPLPLSVEGAGLLDCQLYRQRDRLVLHMVNLTSAGTWRSPIHELIRVGPFRVQLRPAEVADASVHLLVAGSDVPAAVENGVVTFEVPAVTDHEVAVVALC
ncbi:alpha-amylase family protein [Pseudonocardia nigra]|uniref:alpha-amylase family protein n=1 Tax=Pseudonocardia nigra TaxID=1921578 RepID=UPI001C5FAEB7|nr:hypothetical protein [Pseudonocardia nigra]